MLRAHSPISRILVLALLIGHCLALTMAWSPGLHHRVHGDADAADHSCAVVGVLGGQLEHPASPTDLPNPRLFASEAVPLPPVDRILPGASRRCGQDRAPPRA